MYSPLRRISGQPMSSDELLTELYEHEERVALGEEHLLSELKSLRAECARRNLPNAYRQGAIRHSVALEQQGVI